MTEAQTSQNRPTPRERRRAEKLETIRETALTIVIEEGLDAFSIHRLADRLDLTVGALYRYYDSVDQLLVAVQVDVLDAVDAYVQRVLSLTDGPAIVRIWAMAKAYVAWSQLQPQRFRLISRFVSTPDPVFADSDAMQSLEPTMRLLGRLAVTLRESGEEGSIEPGNDLTRSVLLWSGIQGLIERQKLNRLQPELFSFDALVDDFVLTMLRGWGASHEVLAHVKQQNFELEFFESILGPAA